ncbi:MAG: aromatic amino acid lyase [Rhizobiales bacterium]|nr:aromatic amino acid lyase [Hyphomicrobiales bacterium]
MTVTLSTRADLTLEALRRVAWQGEAVQFAGAAMTRMAEERKRFMSLIEDPGITVYGVTSGYGQHAKKRLSAEDRKLHAKRPPTPATASWGDLLPERVVRGIIFARLANFIEGHAAITPEVALAVAAMLDGKALPKIPARGQGGAGEILSLGHAFRALAAMAPVAEKDVLSLVNGSPSAAALVSDTALAADMRLAVAVEVFALAAEAFNAPLSHFAAELGHLWNNPHDAWALTQLREAIGPGHGGARRPYQAPVSFRILPRMLGQARRAERLAAEIAEESLAAVTDNPVMLAPDEEHRLGNIISTGGFHNPHAVMAMDAVTAAAVNLITIAERMSAKLLDGNVSLLPDQLGLGGVEGYLGCLPMAITGYEEEARTFAGATLLPGSESGGFGQNDVASPVFLAWSKQEKTGALLEAALASLAFIAFRALKVTDRPVPPKLKHLAEDIRRLIPEPDAGEPLGPAAYQLEARLRERIYRGH